MPQSAVQVSRNAVRSLLLSALVLNATLMFLRAQDCASDRGAVGTAEIGKTTFRIGEPIRLDLVISNSTGTPMMVNTTDYGDNL